MTYSELHDYGLDGANIQVFKYKTFWYYTQNPIIELKLPDINPIIIEAAAFFAWLDVKCYVIESDSDGSVALYQNADGEPIWETWAEWWADARVISQLGKFDGKRDLLDQLLCEYLNDPVNVRYTDCRTVADLPTEFLTAAEKAGKAK